MREVGFRQVVTQIAEATGEKPLEFKDHTPFSNKGTKDLLKLNELASTIRTEIIPPPSNKTIKAQTPLVLMGVCMNVMMEPLHRNDKALLKGYMYNLSIARTTAVTGKHPIVLSKRTVVARMVTANEVPGTVVANGTVSVLQTHRWTKEGCAGLSVKERR